MYSVSRRPTANSDDERPALATRRRRTRTTNGAINPCRLYPVRYNMPEQLWLPGLEAPPRPTDGLFFAVYPDSNTAAGISKLAQQLCGETRARSKPLAAGRLHVTLHHLGNFAGGLPAARVEAAMQAAASISMEPFSVELDTVVSFASKPRPGPLVLSGEEGAVGLHALYDALGRALQNAGIGGDRSGAAAARYTPHVTLAYGMPWGAPRPVEPVCWNVREFALMHSLLGRTRYIALARWPLSGGQS
jgi:RNA 2',3'-cyclic 3'-phosphodiesterase